MRRRKLPTFMLLCMLLTGCSGRLLERSYSSVLPHNATYWESGSEDTLRADTYPDLVNTILLLVDEHAPDGVIRIYDAEKWDAAQMVDRACGEVQQETALGAYLLDYITYSGSNESSYYELRLQFGYRRSEWEQKALINATSTEAIPALLRTAYAEGTERLAIRVGYFATDRAGVEAMVLAVQQEYENVELPPPEEPPEEAETPPDGEAPAPESAAAPDAPPESAEPSGEEAPADGAEDGEEDGAEEIVFVPRWPVHFYPDTDFPGIVEIELHPAGDTAVAEE